MDVKAFRDKAEEVVDYIADYFESISQRCITPVNNEPGFLLCALPTSAPKTGESFEKIMEDFEKYIMSGTLHWQHPRFHGYFPCIATYPSILAETVMSSIGSFNFNWNISCSDNELESIVLDWYGEMMGLPGEFLYYGTKGSGGAFLHNSTSENMFLSLITARKDTLKRLKDENPHMSQVTLLSSLIAYCSNESHSCAEKAAMLSLVTMRVLETDECFRLRGETVARAIEEDKKNGLIPFYITITMGTTSCCSCDPVNEIGPICKANNMWLNVDAAYAGSALICPEYRYLLEGMEYASSVLVNPCKWMLINLEASVMWTRYYSKVADSFHLDSNVLFYGTKKDWSHPTTKRFRVLKLWFVIRNYGVKGLQEHIRNHVKMAKLFESYVRADRRFELITSDFGLVCFRLKGSNSLNKKLLMAVNASGKLYITPTALDEKYVIRFCVCAKSASEDDINYAWSVFCDFAVELLELSKNSMQA